MTLTPHLANEISNNLSESAETSQSYVSVRLLRVLLIDWFPHLMLLICFLPLQSDKNNFFCKASLSLTVNALGECMGVRLCYKGVRDLASTKLAKMRKDGLRLGVKSKIKM